MSTRPCPPLVSAIPHFNGLRCLPVVRTGGHDSDADGYGCLPAGAGRCHVQYASLSMRKRAGQITSSIARAFWLLVFFLLLFDRGRLRFGCGCLQPWMIIHTRLTSRRMIGWPRARMGKKISLPSSWTVAGHRSFRFNSDTLKLASESSRVVVVGQRNGTTTKSVVQRYCMGGNRERP